MPDRKSPVNAFDAWMQWPERRTYDRLVFCPGSPTNPSQLPKGGFNLFRGYPIEPAKGPWPLLRKHLLNVVCGGDETLLTWLLDWFAQLLQDPQRKMGTALVLRSPTEGSGKSVFSELMQQILGHAVLSASRSDHVVGRFSSQFETALLLVAEEAVFAGSRAADGVLKDMITCTTMAYEAKGLPLYSAPNYTRIIFISNADWVVPAGPTSRRYAVFDCDNPRANDRAYFDPLFAEITKEGGAAAFLAEMLEREITSDLRTPPITKGLLEQRAMSLDGLGKWLLNAAESGEVRIPGKDSERTIELSVAEDLGEKQGAEITFADLRASATSYLDQYELRAINTKLGTLLKSVGAKKGKVREHVHPDRPWGYHFPPLTDFRAAVEQRLGVKVEPFVDEIPASEFASTKGAKVVSYHAAKRAAEQLRAQAN